MNNIPTITKNLLIINILVFFAQVVLEKSGVMLENWLGLHFVLAEHFYLWQPLTYIFLHGSFTHLFFNMFALWMFGRIMEITWGPRRFLVFFLACGVGAGLTQEVVQAVKYVAEGYIGVPDDAILGRYGEMLVTKSGYIDMWNTIGASGAVYGILLAFGLTYPEERMFIFPLPLPIPAKYFVIGYAIIELMCGFGGSRDGVAHFAHLGGMLFGWLLILYWEGRLHMPHMANPFSRQMWHTIINETPINNPEEEWNARRRAREAEIDRILDKVRKHGYGSLDEHEKRVLFNAGNK